MAKNVYSAKEVKTAVIYKISGMNDDRLNSLLREILGKAAEFDKTKHEFWYADDADPVRDIFAEMTREKINKGE